jgi:hypothetical protein
MSVTRDRSGVRTPDLPLSRNRSGLMVKIHKAHAMFGDNDEVREQVLFVRVNNNGIKMILLI